MKRVYIKPEIDTCIVISEKILGTDTYGYTDEFEAKENNLLFEDDDNFGDTWGVDSNNLWGDEE